ncbi:acyl--CoA ligase [Streptomyces sp. S07_1.15]|uniref:class I adenylate-forming enzyme family protein n=1 Tax=Streptomyces sp. S07_1.15 TaxID=2873925 RepID=UPI001D14196C|nr:class I adenylate-forming enzyme family protein [Streptomyces sp. S07_1.15]MCC3651636.1 acyl--CoA ligase [Streptomyces sp. S07_1.15]
MPGTEAPGPRLAGAEGVLEGPALDRRILAAARALREHGVRTGDRVLIQGDNSTGYVVALLALTHLGACVVPVDHGQSAAGTRAAAEQARARWLLCRTPPAAPPPGTHVLSYPGLGEGLAPLPGRPDPAGWFARPDAVVLWSSGTTGRPKGIVKSGAAVRDNTERTLAGMGYRSGDVLAPLLPFSHQYGLSVILLWWLSGSTLVVTPYQRLDRAVALAAAHGVTAVDAAPSTYHALLGLVRRRPAVRPGLDGVRIWGVGGAPLDKPLAEAFRAALGRPLLDGYGLSELGNVALATPGRPVGCGRPLPGVRVRVRAPGGRLAAPGEPGEIEVLSPGLMAGYLTGEGELTPVDREAWYRTGDLGRLDEDGNLHVTGRHHAVHRLGHTLFPESLERKAESCGRQVKVVAVRDPRRGHALHFFVADPEAGASLDWRRRMAPHLAEFEQPNAVHVVERFPVNPNGKVDTAALRELIGTGDRHALTGAG